MNERNKERLTFVAIAAAAVAVSVGIVWGGSQIIHERDTQEVPATIVPTCLTEDSEGPCWWDASVSGNQTGDSFVVDADGNVTYLSVLPSCADAPEFKCLDGEDRVRHERIG